MTSNTKGIVKVVAIGAGAALTAATAGAAAIVVVLSGVVASLGAAITLQSEPMARTKRTAVKGGAKGQAEDAEDPK
jgi:hypothetical protein